MPVSQIEHVEIINKILRRKAIPENKLLATSAVLLTRKLGYSAFDHWMNALSKTKSGAEHNPLTGSLINFILVSSLDEKPAVYDELHTLVDHLKKGEPTTQIENDIKQVLQAESQLRISSPQGANEGVKEYDERIRRSALTKTFAKK